MSQPLDPNHVFHTPVIIRNTTQPGTDYYKQFAVPTDFKQRPGYNSSGKAIQLSVNAVPVTQFPRANVYQYDVIIGSGAEKRIVQQKVWQSKARREKTGPGMIYDGNRLAWSLTQLNEVRVQVDLDVEEGRPSRDGGKNQFRVRITPAKKMDISVLQAFLDGRVPMGANILESISFLDHLLREGPSNNSEFTAVRRSFFARNGERADLGGAVEVCRGVYQSLRLAEGGKLIVNVDIANTTFWQPTSLLAAIIANQKMRDPQQLISACRPEQSNGSKRLNALVKTLQSRFKSTTVQARYKGNPSEGKEWKIFKFSTNNATEEKIRERDPQTKQETGKDITIAEYFLKRYNKRLEYPQLPLIEMTKKNVKYPLELLHIIQGQRYGAKLDETQTANMIKFAVSPPQQRLDAIKKGKDMLNWRGDVYLQKYGLQMGDEIKTNARLLPPPGVQFGNKVEQPGTKGRWDLRGKTFLSRNPHQLKSWGIGVFGQGRIRAEKPAIDKFAADFAKAYRQHGGDVANNPPHIMNLPPDAGQAVEQLYIQTGNKFGARPQLMIFLVQDKNSFFYQRIKKSADCRYGIVSQVMQLQQVLKSNPQYYSNVLMKVNAKLGGCTTQVKPAPSSGFQKFTYPTMFIGADVSHASPGSAQASMAALTVSFDRHAGRYATACQTNGHRVEMITESNMRGGLGPLITQWTNSIGGGSTPSQVFYMRDGVSEGQFAHVLQQEVPHIKAVLSKISGKPWAGKLTVIVASKRHHIRAFPPKGSEASDQKGNPVPGCLIERDVTTPREWDFYLYSHIALQGTSRPVHYTVLLDEANLKPEFLQNMIYEHCYQYMRSTSSVSLHPAVYYAHLASNRARAHEDLPASAGPQGGPGFKQNVPSSDSPPDSESKPLVKMNTSAGIQFAMWYI
jgi:eukaryotic translation initiation factor 2C